MSSKPEVIAKAQRQLLDLHAALGSWAAVAEELGLEEGDRAAVHMVAVRGSVQVKVLEALGLPSRFVEVIPCQCGRVHQRGDCEAGRIAARREAVAAAGAEFPVSGIVRFRDRDGQLLEADLSQRARRLGLDPERAGTVTALLLFDLIVGRQVLEPAHNTEV